MVNCFNIKKGLNGNLLKILAMIFMTIDHAGLILFNDNVIMRIIGRLAFPIFAFMIAEGCFYTKNKAKHFLFIFGLGVICQLFYYFFDNKSIDQCILITFSLSIIMIYAFDYMIKKKNFVSVFLFSLSVAFVAILNYLLPKAFNKSFYFDYGFFGALLPLLIYFFKDHRLKILFLIIGCVLVSIDYGGIQWYSLLSLPFIVLYDGTKGKRNIKYLFYIYYPLHLSLLYFLSFVI